MVNFRNLTYIFFLDAPFSKLPSVELKAGGPISNMLEDGLCRSHDTKALKICPAPFQLPMIY